MSNAVYLRFGKIFFAIAIIAIGVVHLVNRDFPAGLLPIPATVPGRAILVYITGIALILAGLMLLIEKYTRYGAILAGIIWGVLLIVFQLPRLALDIHNPGPWTSTFENAGIFSGALFLISDQMSGSKSSVYKLIAYYLFMLMVIVFGTQHYMYVKFIATLIPAWLPAHLFWAWLVMIAFFAAALSILMHIKVRLTATLLAIMFLLWVVILHLPRAFGDVHVETEWTSTFVALAMSGVSLLLARSTTE